MIEMDNVVDDLINTQKPKPNWQIKIQIDSNPKPKPVQN